MSMQTNGVSAPNDSQKISDLSIEKTLSAKIKGIAILMVIFGHMNYIDCAGAWGVHLFLIISGYGITISLEKNSTNKYWEKRIKNVYLPYLLTTIIFLIVRLFLGEKISLFSAVISLIGFDFGRNLDQTMWYISYIFAWYAIAWLLYILRNKKSLCIGFGAFALFLMAALGYTSVIWRRGTIAWAYFASFPLGMLLAVLNIRNKKLPLSVKNSLLAVMACICLTIVCLDYGKPHRGIDELVFTFSASLGVLSAIILLNKNTKISGGG